MSEEESIKSVDVEAIGEHFEEKNYFQRLGAMFKGLGMAHDTPEYKLARVELQRQAAPLIAFVSVFLFVIVLIVVTALQPAEEKGYEIVIQEQEEQQPPPEAEEEPPDPPPDPEPTPMDDLETPIDQPSDPNPISNISTPTPTPPQKNVSVKPAEANTVAKVNSPVKMRSMVSSRNPGSIGAATRGGDGYGDANTEAAVLKVLWWLKDTQKPDGSWNGGGPSAKGAPLPGTALAILTYLAHGEYPGSPSPYRNDFGPVVQKAIDYIISGVSSDSKGVTMRGTDKNDYAFLIATYALCEAYGMTKNPNVKDTALLCLERIVKGQSSTGGWDYHIDPKSNRDDLSFGGWALQALKAGKMAGLHPDGLEECIKKAVKCMKDRNYRGGNFSYCAKQYPKREAIHPGLTATGCLAMQLLGYGKESEVTGALDYMREWVPAWGGGDVSKQFPDKSSQYYCYYATQCKYQAGMKQGAQQKDVEAWQKWNKEMKKLYTAAVPDGQPGLHDLPGTVKDYKGGEHKKGYYTNLDQYSSRPVMDSCLAALQLMVYYRYLPTTQTTAGADDDSKTSSKVDKDEVEIEVDF